MTTSAPRIVTPAFAISLVIFASFAWILTSDIMCTASAGGSSLLQACQSKPEAYQIFPNPTLYFLELTELPRIVQLLILATADLLIAAALFRLNVTRKRSWLAVLVSLVLFLIASQLFAFLVIAAYLIP